ncbi:YqeG family HAD IIIA-type phosphatase [Oscillatoriales cyanobacterium LEGE 11467]|uniref:YqeG family HAD IIIA-type phosphatase n=1 Tax=Zarconia navalis LEGE 11467 TaxID=1828826 RepID=A0A928Z9H9_9CYAN|nr:YqeG family HAD IIIA-type phosphatase [Zarconia navalis]MBE9040781.1 YqeG family HAD IIIA-type phosphatase [Zarconia navalis LEGE 11467]
MSWGKLLQPDLVLGDSILSLTPEILENYQLDGLVLDVDDTLLPMTSLQMSPVLRQKIAQLREIVQIWLVSNNINESRIGAIARSLDVPYLAFAGKPMGRKLRKAVAAMNLPPQRVGMVGDRLFTDVLAGNRLEMFTILVEPMVEPGEIAKNSTVRAIEVWFSQALGASVGGE